MNLRAYAPADSAALAELFTTTVHTVNRRDYTPEQLDAWAPRPPDMQRWATRLARTQPLVATMDHVIAGFAELEPNGHIDMLYVHHAYQGHGIGHALLLAIAQQARDTGLERLFVEVSITAQPFFLRHGFQIITPQTVTVRGVDMTNVRMEKMFSHTNQRD